MMNTFLELSNLTKSFAGNVVLQEASLSIRPGEFRGLVGENGAGKSTLINLLTGVYQPDSGSITIDGEEFQGLTPDRAARTGIRVVHQELSLSPHLTIAQNMFLGEEVRRRGSRLLKKKRMREDTIRQLATVGLRHLSPDTLVHKLSLAEQQLIEFLKATYQEPRLLILDEATSALETDRVETMFKVLRNFRERGMAIIFVSHRLPEVFKLCEKVTVLKDGKKVATRDVDDVDEEQLVSLMTGREFAELFPSKPPISQVMDRPEILTVEDLHARGVHDVGFSLHEGEILGIGGLQGQGQQELLGALFGLLRIEGGKMRLRGKEVRFRHPRQAMSMGLVHLPEDRKVEGLFMPHGIRFNLSFASLKSVSDRFGTVKLRREREMVAEAMQQLKIKAASTEQSVDALSGGNQQKVALAKWLVRNPDILLLNDPTRGIDVGTKQEFYMLLRDLASDGLSIVMVSSSTIELIGLCDRVLVLYEHQLNGVLEGTDLTEENLVRTSVLKQ